MHTVCIHFQKFVKERPVVDDCLTQFFRAGFIALPPQRQCTSGTIILDDDRMIHRQVVRAPIEILEWVATRGHYVRDEIISFAHGARRVVDKARLNATPFAGEGIGLLLGELAQVEMTDTVCPFAKNRFSARLADSLNGPFVLRTKETTNVPTSMRVSESTVVLPPCEFANAIPRSR
jgi:hypothetical protein